MDQLLLGQYLPGNSWVYRVDPRVKMVAVFLLAVAAFGVNRLPVLGFLAAVLALVAVSSGLGWRPWLAGLRPLLWVALFILVFHLFWAPGEPLGLSRQGLVTGALLAGRLVLVALAGVVLVTTTRPLELTDALGDLLGPLARLGLPAQELALMLGLALRFIPVLGQEVERLTRAQKARGRDWESGGLYRRVENWSAVVVPLIVGLFRRADELATAMEARGFVPGVRRTSLYRRPLRPADWALVGASLGLCLLALASRWVGVW